MNINTALGMVERPLQVADCPICNGIGSFAGYNTLPNGECSRVVCLCRRVDPPRDEVDELRRAIDDWRKLDETNSRIKTELREQLADVTRERDELKLQSGNYLGVRDDPDFDCTDAAHPAWWRGHDHTAKVFCQLVNEILDGKDVTKGISGEPWQATKTRLASLREQLSTVQAEAAVMRRIMDENESRLNDLIRRIGTGSDVGWIKHELRFVLQECNPTAGRELLDEVQRKDERIADLERQLAEHKRDAELCRELRTLLKLPSVSIGAGARTLMIYTPRSFEIYDKLREIRDGGAK